VSAETCYRCEGAIPNCQKQVWRSKGIVLCVNCAKAWEEYWRKSLDELFWAFVEPHDD